MAWPIVITVLMGIVRLAAADDLVNYTALFGFSPRQNKDFPTLCKYDGYDVQSYNATTKDGYILSYFRIPPKPSCPANDTKVIILAHGLYLSCIDFIVGGPGLAHAYIYADLCYDVFVINTRGNRYSRAHVSLDPDKDRKFWDFSFFEMAFYDVPALIDDILKVSGASKLYWLGHSQGITILLICLQKKPEYNAKISGGFGLSVASNFRYARLFVLPLQGAASVLLGNVDPSLSDFEIFPYGGMTQNGVKYLCGVSPLQYPYCSVLIFVVFGFNKFQIPDETLRVAVTEEPCGSSMDDFKMFGSWYNYGATEKDYGIAKNLVEYGQATPPRLDLSNVTAPMYFFLADNDYVADPKDVHSLKTLNNLSNSVVECHIQDPTFGHIDHIYSKYLNVHITPYVASVIETGSCNCTRYTGP